MVDVIVIADPVLQMHVVVDGRENIFLCDMLGNEVMGMKPDRLQQILVERILIHEFSQDGIVNHLRDAETLRIALHPVGQVNHHAGEDLHIMAIRLNDYIGNSGVLDLVRQFLRDVGAGLGQDLTCTLIHHVLREGMSRDTVAQLKLLIIFITADSCQVITPRVKEHAGDERLRALHRNRLSRTDLLVQFLQAGLIIRSLVLCQSRGHLGLISEQVDDLLVGAYSESADQHCDRHLSGTVNPDVKNIIRVCLILKPGSSVGNDGAGIQLLSDLVVGDTVIDAR